ncbi:MAG: TauD/TfdA family dioxygenase [Salinarimonas sp.]
MERGFSYAYPDAPDKPTERIPVFASVAGALGCRYLRAFIEAAGPLTPIEREALDAFDTLAQDPALVVTQAMRLGDLLVVNNYTVLHSRTAFLDHDEPQARRLLLRLWLDAPDFRQVDARIAAQARRFLPAGEPEAMAAP